MRAAHATEAAHDLTTTRRHLWIQLVVGSGLLHLVSTSKSHQPVLQEEPRHTTHFIPEALPNSQSRSPADIPRAAGIDKEVECTMTCFVMSAGGAVVADGIRGHIEVRLERQLKTAFLAHLCLIAGG